MSTTNTFAPGARVRSAMKWQQGTVVIVATTTTGEQRVVVDCDDGVRRSLSADQLRAGR